jgi:manganese transport protein
LIASVAYMDRGDFATNAQAGAHAGYNRLWVVSLANLVAMLFQALSAKLGIVVHRRDRRHGDRPCRVLGASIALELMFHISLLTGIVITGGVTYAGLLLQHGVFRTMKALISAVIGVTGFVSGRKDSRAADSDQIAYHSVVPWLGGSNSELLGAAIVGATVMPHAIYLHGSLAQRATRVRQSRRYRAASRLLQSRYCSTSSAVTSAL